MKRTQHEVAAGPRYHAHTVLPADTHAWCANCGAPDGPTWAGARADLLVEGPGCGSLGQYLCCSCSEAHEEEHREPAEEPALFTVQVYGFLRWLRWASGGDGPYMIDSSRCRAGAYETTVWSFDGAIEELRRLDAAGVTGLRLVNWDRVADEDDDGLTADEREALENAGLC